MKQLTCEVCGGNDLLKQEGVFVCQSCGCKYSADEVKKLMVQISEPVKVDGIQTLEQGLVNAETFMKLNEYKKAEETYKNLSNDYPQDWRCWWGIILSSVPGLYKGNPLGTTNILTTDKYIIKCFENIKLLLKENEFEQLKPTIERYNNAIENNAHAAQIEIDKRKEQVKKDQELANRLFNKFNNCSNKDKALEFLCGVTTPIETKYTIASYDLSPDSTYVIKYETIRAIKVTKNNITVELELKKSHSVFNDPQMDIHQYAKGQRSTRVFDLKKELTEATLKEFDDRNADMTTSSGCYIATCVYGSYDCPQVWSLRRYRDYTLAETWHGRAFIKAYYAISPTLVKLFGNTNWFKSFWKNRLNRIVSNLKNKGFEDKPYDDRKW